MVSNLFASFKKILKTPEYGLKLDFYYYDLKRKTTIVVVKVRNKRVTNKFTIHEMLLNKEILRNLNPIDLCILGIIANTQNKNENYLNRILDDFSMIRIKEILEISQRGFVCEDVITLKIKKINKTIKLSVSELYHNKNLINALSYKDAISLGYAVSETPNFIHDEIIQPQENYSLTNTLINGMYLALLILSALMCNKTVRLNILNSKLFISSEILVLPLLFYLQRKIYRIHGFKIANYIYVCILVSYIIFIFYYSWIIGLPHPKMNINTQAYSEMFYAIIGDQFTYVISFFSACVGYVYFCKVFIDGSNGPAMKVKLAISNFVPLLIFFLTSKLNGDVKYSLLDIFYTTLSLYSFEKCFDFVHIRNKSI